MDVLFFDYPLESLAFFRNAIACSLICGSIVTAIGTALAYQDWEQDGFCNTSFRYFQLIRTLLFALQLPLRLYMLYMFYKANRQRENRGLVIDILVKLTRSWQWQWNQFLGVVVYFMFTVVLLFIWGATRCIHETKYPYYLALLSVAIFFGNMAWAFVWLLRIELTPVGGAPLELIERNSRLIKYEKANPALISNDMCKICLTNYEEEDELRELLCNHSYHKVCVDQWLRQQKICPLCQRPIDTMEPSKKKKE